MSTVRWFFLCGATVMAATIAYGFVGGNFVAEAEVLLPLPWFHVTMIDLYLGFALVGAWIGFRERSPWRTILWLILLICLGNLVSFIYAFIAAVQSEGDWATFWLGRRAATVAPATRNQS